jgi:hypothetical protein
MSCQLPGGAITHKSHRAKISRIYVIEGIVLYGFFNDEYKTLDPAEW